MSLASKITLWSSCIGTVGIIAFVHYKQYDDREKLRQGVVRDLKNQERKRALNEQRLREQIELTKTLEEIRDHS